MKGAKETVFVGLSGGVDSSVAALRLVREGYRAVGVFIKVWQPEFLHCDWEQERFSAMRVCAHLEIPFLTCDAEERYKTEVADYLVSEYRAGRTPNPDVMCNKHIKFGAFLDFAEARGAEYIATGHYARRAAGSASAAAGILRGVDTAKDQSYFLWTLTAEQLSRTLFPIGDSLKSQVRAEAKRAGLPTAEKPDSQGICFLGELNMKEFLRHFIASERGSVEDTNGRVVGEHDGAQFYTIGERHGFRLQQESPNAQPYYIVATDLARNALIVSHEKPVLASGAARSLALSETNWIGRPPQGRVSAQTRYRQKPVLASVEITGAPPAPVAPGGALVRAPPGQSCVVYNNEKCLGGGIIHAVS